MNTKRYAIRCRGHEYNQTKPSPWKTFDVWDLEVNELIEDWATRAEAESAIPSPVVLNHNEYSVDFEVIVVGSRDHLRALKNG